MPLDAVQLVQHLAAYKFDMTDSQVTDRDLSGFSIITTKEGTYYAFDKLTDIHAESTGPPQIGTLYYIRHRRTPGIHPRLFAVAVYSLGSQPLQLDGTASVFPNTPDGETLHVYKGLLGMTCRYKGGWFRPDYEQKVTIDATVSLRYQPDDPAKHIRVEMTGQCRQPVDRCYRTVTLQAESFNPLVTTQQTSAVYKLLNPQLQIL